MGIAERLVVEVTPRQALLLGAAVALVATLIVMPRLLRKLRGAGIVGRDINKPDRPEIPEMGGLGVFLGFNAGVFAVLLFWQPPAEEHAMLLVAMITAAGAAMTGVIDDLVELRQRFKAFIPVVFAAPLAFYLNDYSITFPLVGTIDFGLLYPLVLVPLGITCASNSFNMLEGYNGLGAGLGIIMAIAISILAYLNGALIALALTLPLAGALLAFLVFNRYPAKVFPGDTMTLLVGAVLAAAGMIGKVEFWAALLFVPHIIEFFLKARGNFAAENFAREVKPRGRSAPLLAYEGNVESLTHLPLRSGKYTEPLISATFWGISLVLATLVVMTYVVSRAGG